jgi:hypothetical protein
VVAQSVFYQLDVSTANELVLYNEALGKEAKIVWLKRRLL